MSDQIEIRTHASITEIGQTDWDACACAEQSPSQRAIDPFTTYRFLRALEESGSVGPGTGWQPLYLTARVGENVIGCAPMFGKSHSQGEYIFDHNWAHAFERAGGRYFPKLQIAVPFTPATGRRLLTKLGFQDIGREALLDGAAQIARNNRLSSVHITFCTEEERKTAGTLGYLERITQQYHWYNSGYKTFDDFLEQLSSRKRKAIRKERSQAQAFGGEIISLTGQQIQTHHWDAFWQFYQDTGHRKWGTPYLTRAFFDLAQQTLCDDILLVLAIKNDHPVAGALNFIGQSALYGRYWGCVEDHPCLHFELCYYQAIDYAIAHGLNTVEAGAQGDHKLARGYLPAPTHSAHWIADEGFSNAVADYLNAERSAMEEEIEVLTAYGPFKKSPQEDYE